MRVDPRPARARMRVGGINQREPETQVATSSPTTADIKNAIAGQIKDFLVTKLGDDYAVYTRLTETLALVGQIETEFRDWVVDTPVVSAPTPAKPPEVNACHDTHYTARARVRLYLRNNGPRRLAAIHRDTGIPRGTLSGLLNSASTEFVSETRGVWKLRGGK